MGTNIWPWVVAGLLVIATAISYRYTHGSRSAGVDAARGTLPSYKGSRYVTTLSSGHKVYCNTLAVSVTKDEVVFANGKRVTARGGKAIVSYGNDRNNLHVLKCDPASGNVVIADITIANT